EFLDHPKYCPHGGAILPEDMKSEDLHSESLTDVDYNVSVSISRFVNEEKLVHYFKNQNLNINDVINIKYYDKTLDLYEIDNESNNKTIYNYSKFAIIIYEIMILQYYKNQYLNINDVINIKYYDKTLDLYEIDNESNNETIYISSKIAQFIFVRK